MFDFIKKEAIDQIKKIGDLMARVQVVPLAGDWVVKKNGRSLKPTHRKKSAAKKHAKREANVGDRLIIHDRSGSIISNNLVTK